MTSQIVTCDVTRRFRMSCMRDRWTRLGLQSTLCGGHAHVWCHKRLHFINASRSTSHLAVKQGPLQAALWRWPTAHSPTTTTWIWFFQQRFLWRQVSTPSHPKRTRGPMVSLKYQLDVAPTPTQEDPPSEQEGWPRSEAHGVWMLCTSSHAVNGLHTSCWTCRRGWTL